MTHRLSRRGQSFLTVLPQWMVWTWQKGDPSIVRRSSPPASSPSSSFPSYKEVRQNVVFDVGPKWRGYLLLGRSRDVNNRQILIGFEIILVNVFMVCGGFTVLSALARLKYISQNSFPCSFLVRVGHREFCVRFQWK